MRINFKLLLLFPAMTLFLIIGQLLFAGGSIEEGSAGAVNYEASRGRILRAEEIAIDSLVASVNYTYPPPTSGDFSVIFRSGHRQVGNKGQEELLLIGLQGPPVTVKELPPLNVVFVIDRSGSMESDNKMDWVKASFSFFMRNVKDDDYVALVAFNATAEVLFPSTRMKGMEVRDNFIKAVDGLYPDDGTDLTVGLKAGYEQAMANFRSGYINVVIFLTDGVGNTAGIYDMAASYRKLGIGVSAIGLGAGFDREVIRQLALNGGGTSRFIGDRSTMEEAFGTGLPRLIAPAVKDLVLTLTLEPGVEPVKTWAYDYAVQERVITYKFPVLQSNDYETIIAAVKLPAYQKLGETVLAMLAGTYKDLEGKTKTVKPHSLSVVVTPDASPVDGITDGYLLKAGTVLDFGRTMREIGTIYHEKNKDPGEQRSKAYGLARAARDRIVNAKLRLETDLFDKHIDSLNNYLRVLGGEMTYPEDVIKEVVEIRDMVPEPDTPSFMAAAARFFDEIKMEASDKITGTLAVSGFSFTEEKKAPLLDLLDNSAEVALKSLKKITLVDRKQLDKVLAEQKLSLTGLFETDTAIEVGKLLSAQYMLTGTIITMRSSIAVFSRIINVTTGVVESAAQIVLPRNKEIEDLL